MAETERVGEVIEASTTGFTAQCYQLYQIPPLGSLVKTGSSAAELYAIVYNAETSSLEPGRKPIARGQDEKAEEDIYRSSPQLAKLLRSEFGAVVVGHKDGDRLYQHLPPQPARIHSFVYQCTPQEVIDFGKSFDFLSILLNANLPVPAEELVGAALRQMSRAHKDPRAFLVAAGKELAILLSGNLGSLNAILGRMKT
ncbi:MAG: hypothetical protein PVJ08_07765 [Dehalococcoidia bacterium]|jgi:hypothetical protein